MIFFKALIFILLSTFTFCSFAKDAPAKPQYSPDGQCVSISTSSLSLSACNNTIIRVVASNNSSSYILTPRVQYKDFSIKSCVITSESGVISDKISLVCPQFSVDYNSGRSSFSFKDELERKFKIEEN